MLGILLGVLVSSIVHLYLWPDSEAPAENPPCGTLSPAGGLPRRPEGGGSAGSLLVAFTDSEALIHRVRAEPLGTYAHPRPGERLADARHRRGDRPPQRRLPTQRRAGDPTLTR